MNIEDFWSLIGHAFEASNGDPGAQVELLVARLANDTTEEILAYDSIFESLMDRAKTATLWDAADIIGCGCGYDDFSDFRGWLIAHGKEVYENAISDPETLVDLVKVDERARCEEFLYVSLYAYERKTGEPLPRRREMIDIEVKCAHSPEKEKRFPRLAAKFGDCRKRWSLFP